jgi:N6-L-threonylcarbamoyladenine synthase
MQTDSIILGIESSCDDTSAAVLINGKVCSNITANQDVHRKFGGVVPELASRAHQSNIIPVIDQAISTAGIQKRDISAIAVTQGPGLMGSLIVGLNTAKSLSMGWNVPLIGVNHLQAHVAALFIDNNVEFPMLCLLVSGGHTQLIWAESFTQTEIIGETIDDAVGEAFDKASKLMGLGYPGGPIISKMASTGNDEAFKFSDSQVGPYDFSFSGVKTSLLYFLRDEQAKSTNFIEENIHDICASYEKALINMLMKRFKNALKDKKPNSISIAGGVSANKRLRLEVEKLSQSFKVPAYIPDFQYCTDNAAMIAKAGQYLFEDNQFISFDALPYSRSK